MDKLNIELCPETGICSIVRKNGTKVDLMPDEVRSLKDAKGDAAAARRVLAEADPSFAEAISPDELAQVAKEL